jgi:hypothetical protein
MSAQVLVLTPWTGAVLGQFSLFPWGPMYTGTWCQLAVVHTAYTRPGCAEPGGETATPPGIELQPVCVFDTGIGRPHGSEPLDIRQDTMYTAEVTKSWYSRYTTVCL